MVEVTPLNIRLRKVILDSKTREREARRIQQEEFIKNYKVQQKEQKMIVQESTHPLGYTIDYIKLTEQQMYD